MAGREDGRKGRGESEEEEKAKVEEMEGKSAGVNRYHISLLSSHLQERR